MSEKVRRIKCAAIQHNGVIHEGESHGQIWSAMIRAGVCSCPFPGGEDQGFLTEDGEFVSRSEARLIALHAGQVRDGDVNPFYLFSEDFMAYKPTPSSGGHAANEVRMTNEATGGQKGAKLEDFAQIPPSALRELAEHFGRGARKYKKYNFLRGYDWSLSYSACQRHLWQFWGGEDCDPETRSKHVIAAAWHCLALAWYMDHKREWDDRPTPENLKKSFAAEDAAKAKESK